MTCITSSYSTECPPNLIDNAQRVQKHLLADPELSQISAVLAIALLDVFPHQRSHILNGAFPRVLVVSVHILVDQRTALECWRLNQERDTRRTTRACSPDKS